MNNSIFKSALAVSVVAVTISSCATPPDKIEASYVSPLQYEPYTCEQLGQEASRISQRAAEASGVQKKKAQGDAVAVGVSLILFWPAVFFVKGKGANEQEVARLKGEMDTIEKVSIQKNCGFQFQGEQPPQQATNAIPTQSPQSTQPEPEVIQAPEMAIQ